MKDIKGYEGLYKISKQGEVYSVRKGKIMCPYVAKDGVLRISLTKDDKRKTYTVHRLVAQAFLDNPENKPQVDHIDGNKQNNCIKNLRWCTNEENQAFRKQQGNEGKDSVSKKIKWGTTTYNSIRELAKHIAKLRGSKEETVRKEIKAVRYGGKKLYGQWCELV